MLPGVRPMWLVCEDGDEYHDRFSRFLDGEFRFGRAGDAAALLDALAAEPACGVILDLDFRRTSPERLVDADGRAGMARSPGELKQLAATQGILILRLLRARGHRVPVLLYADLDDAEQASWLESTLGPLAIVPGHEGLVQTAARMRAIGGGAAG